MWTTINNKRHGREKLMKIINLQINGNEDVDIK